MNFYKDKIVTVDQDVISLKGILLPVISSVKIRMNEIHNIEVDTMSKLERVNLMGSIDLKTWWAFDALRPIRKSCYKIYLKKPIGPFKVIAFTATDSVSLQRVLKSNFRRKFVIKHRQ